MGEEADFLANELSAKPEQTIKNVNLFGACLENFSGGHYIEDLGYVLMELSKLCVP